MPDLPLQLSIKQVNDTVPGTVPRITGPNLVLQSNGDGSAAYWGAGGGGGGSVTVDDITLQSIASVLSVKAGGLTDTHVAATAGIAGTKISPNFGAQNIITTGALLLGATPASAGTIRLPKSGSAAQITSKNFAGTSGDLIVYTASADSTDSQVFGSTLSGRTTLQGGSQAALATSDGTTLTFNVGGGVTSQFPSWAFAGTPVLKATDDTTSTSGTGALFTLAGRSFSGAATGTTTGGSVCVAGGAVSGPSGTRVGGDGYTRGGVGSSANGFGGVRNPADNTWLLKLNQTSNDFMQLGATVANAGTIRLATSGTIQAAGFNSIAALKVYSNVGSGITNTVEFGDVQNDTTTLRGASVAMQNAGGVNITVLNGTSPSTIYATATLFSNGPDGSGSLADWTMRARNNTSGVGASLILQGGTGSTIAGNVALGLAPSSWNAMGRGLFLGKVAGTPTGNPANGLYAWSTAAGELVSMSTSGDLRIGDGSLPITFQAENSVSGYTFGLPSGGIALTLFNNAVATYFDEFRFNNANTNSNKQIDIASTNQAGVTAGTLNINGQSVTGTGSIGGSIQITAGGGPAGNGSIFLAGKNVALNSTGGFGSGAGVTSIGLATTAPTTNPSNGSILFVDPADNKTKIRGSSGTVTVLANP